MAERTESVILDFQVDESESIESIASLTKANKALREERNKLNLQSESGKKRAQEINAILDQNTEKIKSNVSALEKQKINIGNYKSALDGVVPGLGGFAQGVDAGTKGLKGMTMQALKFLATPLGAALAAIVAVFTLLKSALSQNDALMDKFENVTNAVGVVLEVVAARVGKLGEALIALASGNFGEAINLTAQAFSGLGDEIENAVKQQQLFLNASRDLEDSQRNLRIEVARQTTVITGLIKESKNRNLTLDESSAKLIQASKLEAELQRTREDIAFRDLVITSRRLRADKEFQQQSNETFDQYIERLLSSSKLAPAELDKISEKVVALEEARNSGLVLQQKIENDLTAIELKRADALKKQNDALSEQEALNRANQRAANQPTVSDEDPLVSAFQDRANVIIDIEDRMQSDLKKRKDDAAREDIDRAKKGLEIQKTIEEQKLQAAAGIAAGIAGLLDEQSSAYKAFASAQVVISTYAAATKAYEAAFLPVPTVASPGLGVAFAAAAILQGLANLAKINGVQFAEGGWTGPGRKYDAVGVVHADEYVAPKWIVNSPQAQPYLSALESMRLRGYADGGLVVNSVTHPVDQQMQISNILKNVEFAIGVREITKMQKRVKVKEQISKR